MNADIYEGALALQTLVVVFVTIHEEKRTEAVAGMLALQHMRTYM